MAKERKVNPVDERAIERYAELLISKMEEIDSNWKKPWVSARKGWRVQNLAGRNYSGINSMLLGLVCDMSGYQTPVFGTFERIKDLGVSVRKGEVSLPVKMVKYAIYDTVDGKYISQKDFGKLDPERQKKCEERKTKKYYFVFNIDQTNMAELKPELYNEYVNKFKAEIKDESEMMHEPLLDYMLENNTWVCPIKRQAQNGAFYSINNDDITVPLKGQCDSGEAFYGTLLHEMAHSTGADGRLDRDLKNAFGSKNYGREELVAELSSAIVCSNLGISKCIEEENLTNDEHASYLKNWIEAIKEDPGFIRTVLSDVAKASGMILEKVQDVNVEKKIIEGYQESIHEKIRESSERMENERLNPVVSDISELGMSIKDVNIGAPDALRRRLDKPIYGAFERLKPEIRDAKYAAIDRIAESLKTLRDNGMQEQALSVKSESGNWFKFTQIYLDQADRVCLEGVIDEGQTGDGFDIDAAESLTAGQLGLLADGLEDVVRDLDSAIMLSKEERIERKAATYVSDIIRNNDLKQRYRLLSRMKLDLKYMISSASSYLGHDESYLNRVNDLNLYCHDERVQVKVMRGLMESFQEKPEWLSMEDLDIMENDLRAIREITYDAGLMKDRLYGIVSDADLFYVPIRLPQPVYISNPDYDELSQDARIPVFHAMVSGDDIVVYHDIYDSYDDRNGISVSLLPEQERREVMQKLLLRLGDPCVHINRYIDTVDMPEYAVTAIFHGDYSGMSDEDRRQAEDFMKRYPDCSFNIRSDEKYFSNNAAFGLPTDCVKMDIVAYPTLSSLIREHQLEEQKNETVKVIKDSVIRLDRADYIPGLELYSMNDQAQLTLHSVYADQFGVKLNAELTKDGKTVDVSRLKEVPLGLLSQVSDILTEQVRAETLDEDEDIEEADGMQVEEKVEDLRSLVIDAVVGRITLPYQISFTKEQVDTIRQYLGQGEPETGKALESLKSDVLGKIGTDNVPEKWIESAFSELDDVAAGRERTGQPQMKL